MHRGDERRVDRLGVVHVVRQNESKHEYGHFFCMMRFDEGFYDAPTPEVARVDRTLLPPSCLACIVAR